MNIRLEVWNGYQIRFIERAPGDWWAIAKDVTDALGFAQAADGSKRLPGKYRGMTKVPTLSGEQEMVVLSEKGLYRLIMRSNKPKAESFQDWVYDTLKMLREASGLEGYQIFRMLDKEHQLESMRKLREGMRAAEQVDYIRANTIANKAVSNAFGHAKLVKKDDMTPEMLAQREPILEDVVSLMAVNDRYALGLSVSKLVYGKYCLEGEDP